jgi:lipopolysaccharide transport protein LptA
VRRILAALAVVLLATPVRAQPAAPVTPAKPAVETQTQGRLRADKIRYATKEQVIIATGNVLLVMGDLEMRADSLRLEQGPQVATAEGRVAIQRKEMRLTAATVRYEIRTEIADAGGGVVVVQKDATIKAPQMRFELRDEITTATGGVEVEQGGGTLAAATLRYQARTGDVNAEGGVKMVREGSTIAGRRLVANLTAKKADVREDVTFVRAPGSPPAGSDRVARALSREETKVTAARIVFRWDTNEAEAEGHVIVRQPDKTGWADRMVYSEAANKLTLTGNVIVEQLSGDWLVREGVTTPPRDPQQQQALRSITKLTCNRLTMTLKERDIVAEGSVKVTQKDRWATGDRATYTEATRVLVVTGSVRMQETDGRRLQADRVVISLVDETFEAEGNVQTEFIIRTSPTPTRRP